jgi:hypothetical protein
MNRSYFSANFDILFVFCEFEWFSYDFSKINVVKWKIAMPRALPSAYKRPSA